MSHDFRSCGADLWTDSFVSLVTNSLPILTLQMNEPTSILFISPRNVTYLQVCAVSLLDHWILMINESKLCLLTCQRPPLRTMIFFFFFMLGLFLFCIIMYFPFFLKKKMLLLWICYFVIVCSTYCLGVSKFCSWYWHVRKIVNCVLFLYP